MKMQGPMQMPMPPPGGPMPGTPEETTTEVD